MTSSSCSGRRTLYTGGVCGANRILAHEALLSCVSFRALLSQLPCVASAGPCHKQSCCAGGVVQHHNPEGRGAAAAHGTGGSAAVSTCPSPAPSHTYLQRAGAPAALIACYALRATYAVACHASRTALHCWGTSLPSGWSPCRLSRCLAGVQWPSDIMQQFGSACCRMNCG